MGLIQVLVLMKLCRGVKYALAQKLLRWAV